MLRMGFAQLIKTTFDLTDQGGGLMSLGTESGLWSIDSSGIIAGLKCSTDDALG